MNGRTRPPEGQEELRYTSVASVPSGAVKESERYWRNLLAAPPAQTSGFSTVTNTSDVDAVCVNRAVSLTNIQGPDNRSASLSASDSTVSVKRVQYEPPDTNSHFISNVEIQMVD